MYVPSTACEAIHYRIDACSDYSNIANVILAHALPLWLAHVRWFHRVLAVETAQQR